MAGSSILHCSFCGRSRDEVEILLAGQDVHICENCVEHARELIEQELNMKEHVVQGVVVINMEFQQILHLFQ